MSAAAQLPTIVGTISAGAALVSLVRSAAVQHFLDKHLGSGATSTMWKLAAVAFALTNLKNLPGFWHIRVLRGILYQLYLQPTPQPPRHLFSPLITSSRNTLYDCDYNLHKSNSTYFADLDVARAHAVGCIIRTGLNRLNSGDEAGLSTATKEAKGKYYVALGGVSCFFQKQIEPLQAFEIYTRVLSWDRKWLYLVSHVVEKGKVVPERWVLQPWKNNGKEKRRRRDVQKEEEDLSKYVFATSVARYVFKKGRLTISPEVVLERSRLLPERPEGVGLPPREEAGSAAGSTGVMTPATPGEGIVLGSTEANGSVVQEVGEKLGEIAGRKTDDVDDEEEEWTWEDMEKERLRGLKTAVHFDRLSAVHNEFRAGDVLGKYGDYW